MLALQEVHGISCKFQREFFQLLREYHYFHSFTPSENGANVREDVGSVVTLVPKDAVSSDSFSAEAIVPGRALRVVFAGKWIHWNIHNHGLNRQQAALVTSVLTEDARFVQARPAERFLVLAGDFNFLPLVKSDVLYADPAAKLLEIEMMGQLRCFINEPGVSFLMFPRSSASRQRRTTTRPP